MLFSHAEHNSLSMKNVLIQKRKRKTGGGKREDSKKEGFAVYVMKDTDF